MDYGQLFSNNNSEEKRLKIEGKKLRLTNIDTDLKASWRTIWWPGKKMARSLRLA